MADKPVDAPVGSGMAKKAVNTLDAQRRYKEAALEAAVAGHPMPDFEDWVRMQK